jgi:hypothetical protein
MHIAMTLAGESLLLTLRQPFSVLLLPVPRPVRQRIQLIELFRVMQQWPHLLEILIDPGIDLLRLTEMAVRRGDFDLRRYTRA